MSPVIGQGSEGTLRRGAVLFANFFLIILAYYQIKPASRSLFIAELGAGQLPYVWIATAVLLAAMIGWYHRLVERHSRLRVVLWTCGVTLVLLVVFRQLLLHNTPLRAVAFYLFVDIFSVVLVEQFWSLANSVHTTDEGRRSYSFVSIGGLLGGVAGGLLAGRLLEFTPLHSHDLLLVAAAFIALVIAINLWMARMGLYRERYRQDHLPELRSAGLRVLLESRYLGYIALLLLMAQLVQPLVEYKFITTVAVAYPGTDARTGYLSYFFSVMGVVAIGVNLTLTPLLHHLGGAMAGLAVQPLALLLSTAGFYLSPGLLSASVMKVCDRGLSYSVNRASKELLYIPLHPVLTYQAKAWIDMLGYRLFKVLGSVVILLLTQWLPVTVSPVSLSWLTMGVCLAWLLLLRRLGAEYSGLMSSPEIVPVHPG